MEIIRTIAIGLGLSVAVFVLFFLPGILAFAFNTFYPLIWYFVLILYGLSGD